VQDFFCGRFKSSHAAAKDNLKRRGRFKSSRAAAKDILKRRGRYGVTFPK
jgi:hypothetical protein